MCEMIERYPMLAYYKAFQSAAAVNGSLQSGATGRAAGSSSNSRTAGAAALAHIRRNKISGFFPKAWLFCTDLETIYIVGYFFLACVGLLSPLIFTILLIDGVKRSKDILEMLLPISYNYKKLLKTIFLMISIIYFYAMIGILSYTDSYQHVITN